MLWHDAYAFNCIIYYSFLSRNKCESFIGTSFLEWFNPHNFNLLEYSLKMIWFILRIRALARAHYYSFSTHNTQTHKHRVRVFVRLEFSIFGWLLLLDKFTELTIYTFYNRHLQSTHTIAIAHYITCITCLHMTCHRFGLGHGHSTSSWYIYSKWERRVRTGRI